MPLTIDGATYYSVDDVCRELEIVRQTLWRWRNSGRVPAGRRYRGRKIVFTHEEVEQVRAFANRLEPLGLGQNEVHSAGRNQ